MKLEFNREEEVHKNEHLVQLEHKFSISSEMAIGKTLLFWSLFAQMGVQLHQLLSSRGKPINRSGMKTIHSKHRG